MPPRGRRTLAAPESRRGAARQTVHRAPARAAEPAPEQATPRQELIDLQKSVSERLRAQIKASLGKTAPAVRLYHAEYDRDFTSFEAVSSKRELVDAVAGADLVFQGDYHTLRKSQLTLVRILHDVLPRRSKIILCIEMVMIAHQEHLDAWMSGRTSDEELLRAIEYERTWGFAWENYREVLAFARANGVRVLALNSDPSGARDHILERDFAAAEVIARVTLEEPDALVHVFDGDLHVAREHLPFLVDSALQRRGATRRKVIVAQNSEAIYWQLAERGLAHQVDVVRLAPDAFCVLNATPIEKLQSYLNWEHDQEELHPVVPPGWEESAEPPDYTEQVHDMVETIARFLEIDASGLDDFSVFTTRDVDFLRVLERERHFKHEEIAEIKRQIADSESYFIAKGNIIYLADFSLNHAAEEASHFINVKCAGYASEPLHPWVDFYYRSLREAIGFFGSKVINHKRECFREKDFELFLEQNRGKRLDARGRMLRAVARYVIQHKAFERRWLRTGELYRLDGIFRQPTDVHLGITHGLGYILGDLLYRGLLSGAVTKGDVRDLFCERLVERSGPFNTYLRLVQQLASVTHDFPSRADHL